MRGWITRERSRVAFRRKTGLHQQLDHLRTLQHDVICDLHHIEVSKKLVISSTCVKTLHKLDGSR
ncbi:hypothetical protein SynSYN20_01145 [Synechococcus sp. SYN20]|nr:hypothetical protein SynSYN20_01145 [Synechococcus sp. SYN20]